MNAIIKIFHDNYGYMRMNDLKKANIHPRKVAEALQNGIIEKIKPGLYKLIGYNWDINQSFTDVYQANSNAVICLTTASEFHKLTSFNPSVIDVAVPHNTSKFTIKYPPVKVYYFISKYYNSGIEIINSSSGSFKVYNKEKTIADLFRYRKKIGEDIVIESIKNYLKEVNSRNINKLMEYANLCKVSNQILPFIKALI